MLGSSPSVLVVGLPALVSIANPEAQDQLVVEGGGGNDQIGASNLAAGTMKLTIDGGAGDDTIDDSRGNDVLLGGDGDDLIDGRQGDDSALMGAGDDRFVWNPGDGNDTVEGQAGFDEMEFNGSGANENIDIAANGGRVRFFRDVANVTMDLDDVEQVAFRALGGADNIVVGDLSGTDMQAIDIDLAGVFDGNQSDGQVDRVTRNGTNGADVIAVVSAGETVAIVGLSADVSIDHAEATDQLVINALGGDDVIDASDLVAGQMALTMNGGLGDDVFIGSDGDDLIVGGDGDDLALMGAGNDTFVWNPGDDDDTLEGQAGFDTMLFNGANIGENIDIAAVGGRVRFFRDVANVTMDLDDVEALDFNALGSADNIVVGDLSGTDVERVHIDLAAINGAGDGQQDRIIINGTNGDDAISVALLNGELVVSGLQAEVVIAGFEAGLDVLQINGLGGDDIIDAAALPNPFGITMSGGEGNDVLIGGDGNDSLFGDAGDDVLLGNAGNDFLDGGAGDDVLIGGDGIDVLVNGEIKIASLRALRPIDHATWQQHAKLLDGFLI